ncbi:uncharacterized protein LOC127635732 [Xyrauchen texanus]|uniref:uncharacterized protein LOC127635732 n=1 Tax=Xyrauchen texanus TaxID=154827 RepID=UPI002242776E|nr:uncharacterized protein LOC127635732 [Xyrauchen texanus]
MNLCGTPYWPLERTSTGRHIAEGNIPISLITGVEEKCLLHVLLGAVQIAALLKTGLGKLLFTSAENVFRGATVHLPCSSDTNNIVRVSVEWKNNITSICNYNLIDYKEGSFKGYCKPRFTLNRTSFALRIDNVQLSDAGNYTCRISRIIPPPSTDSISDVKLHVEDPGLTLQHLNSSNDICILLLCSLERLNPEQVNFTWSREGQRLSHSYNSSGMNSELRLCKPAWREGDTFTCNASYSSEKRLYSQSLQLLSLVTEYPANLTLLLIITCTTGIILCLIFTAVLYKCRKKRDENVSIVFSNKVYENFSFIMAQQTIQANAKPQTEECIYEN